MGDFKPNCREQENTPGSLWGGKRTPEKGKETPSLEKGTPSERNRLRADVHTKIKKDRTLLPATNPQGARLVIAANQKIVLPITENRKEPEQPWTPREKERSSEKPDETKTWTKGSHQEKARTK